jgi:hypothetical protein
MINAMLKTKLHYKVHQRVNWWAVHSMAVLKSHTGNSSHAFVLPLIKELTRGIKTASYNIIAITFLVDGWLSIE